MKEQEKKKQNVTPVTKKLQVENDENERAIIDSATVKTTEKLPFRLPCAAVDEIDAAKWGQ